MCATMELIRAILRPNLPVREFNKQVMDYFVREKGLPIRRMLNPTGFGEEQPVASNDSASGRAMNRRAEVKILVNRADRKQLVNLAELAEERSRDESGRGD